MKVMYSYTTSRRESVQACHYSLFIFTSEKPETKWEKPKTTASTKSEKPLVFLSKTENQVLIKGKPENPKKTPKPENRSFLLRKPKNRSKKWPKPKNRKPQSPPHLWMLKPEPDSFPQFSQSQIQHIFLGQSCQHSVTKPTESSVLL